MKGSTFLFPALPLFLSIAFLFSFASVSFAQAATIYTPALFDHVLPTDPPGGPASGLNFTATPGEYEPATLVVYNDGATLNNVTVTITDLVGPSVVDSENVDIRVVKIWQQAGPETKFEEGDEVLVPEVLVYNDSDSLLGTFSGNKNANNYIPPTVSSVLSTNIPTNTSKQFWLTVHVPESAPAGSYVGVITVKTPTKTIATLPVTLEVLSFELLEPEQSYSTAAQIHIPTSAYFGEELTDIREHGFSSMNLWVSGQKEENVVAQLELLEDYGFQDPIALHAKDEENAALVPILEDSAFSGYLQGVGEPSMLNAPTQEHSIRHHIRESYNIHELGADVGVPIGRNVVEMLLDPNSEAYDQIDPLTGKTFKSLGITNEVPDYPQYGIPLDFGQGAERGFQFWDYIEGLQTGTINKPNDRHEAIYWQAWYERPVFNRMIAGTFLWNSQLDGISAVSYRGAVGGVFGDPNNDFDYSGEEKKRDNTLTYMSSIGPLPTLQWEALREGYDDVRYLTTLFDILDDLKDQDLIDSIKNEVNTELVKYYDARDHELYSGGDFENTRSFLIAKINKALTGEGGEGGETGEEEVRRETPPDPITNIAPIAVITGPEIDGLRTSFNARSSYDRNRDTLTYLWDFGDGTSSTAEGPNHIYAQAGAYRVTLTVSDGELSDKQTISVAVEAPAVEPGRRPFSFVREFLAAALAPFIDLWEDITSWIK